MKKAIIWIGALIVGAILGLFGIAWLDEVMNFVATVYTRLFQLLAVPTIVLAVITTFATFGSKGSGRIFGHTLTYTLLTTFAAAAVGAVLYVLVAPGNLPVETISNGTQPSEISPQTSYIDHIISVIPNNIVKPFFDGNVLSLLLLAFAVGIGLQNSGGEIPSRFTRTALPTDPLAHLDTAPRHCSLLSAVVGSGNSRYGG